jgi:molybdate transport system substrate-binding protein
MRRKRQTGAALAVCLLMSGCDGSPVSPDHVVVFAAASLATVFTAVGDRFTDANPAAAVEFSFAGSADLLTQLIHGAAADVFASADTQTMDKAVRAGLVADEPRAFATNTLTIAVAPGNPKQINAFRDLSRVSVVVCATEVPCGAALPRIEEQTGVDLTPVSEESSVTDVLNKVTSGQADAGLVYLTDTRAAGDRVTAVPFPEAATSVNTYQIAVLKQARSVAVAQRFVDLVSGPVGRDALAAAGFGTP